LNAHTVSDAFPIPDPQDVIQKIGQARHLTVTDATQGYWQTAIKPEDQWKTGFICDDQLYEWTRTAFGMKSSGQTFCRAVQQILYPIKDCAATFVDDMAVYSFVFSQHLRDIERFLSIMREAGITLKLKKCRFALPEVKFCGQIVGSGTRRVDPDKMAAVEAVKAQKQRNRSDKQWAFSTTSGRVFPILLP